MLVVILCYKLNPSRACTWVGGIISSRVLRVLLSFDTGEGLKTQTEGETYRMISWWFHVFALAAAKDRCRLPFSNYNMDDKRVKDALWSQSGKILSFFLFLKRYANVIFHCYEDAPDIFSNYWYENWQSSLAHCNRCRKAQHWIYGFITATDNDKTRNYWHSECRMSNA